MFDFPRVVLGFLMARSYFRFLQSRALFFQGLVRDIEILPFIEVQTPRCAARRSKRGGTIGKRYEPRKSFKQGSSDPVRALLPWLLSPGGSSARATECCHKAFRTAALRQGPGIEMNMATGRGASASQGRHRGRRSARVNGLESRVPSSRDHVPAAAICTARSIGYYSPRPVGTLTINCWRLSRTTSGRPTRRVSLVRRAVLPTSPEPN